MYNFSRVLVAFLPVTIFCGCANLTTISRSTELPGEGRAIHLDAQQRLVYANKKGLICAEPSPDAIQSVAASLGAGISVPTEGAASVSQALQQSTAGIGLRTQSITLMRDALYRICEAYHNEKLNELQVVQLLERSQDVSLGVLAIEQLTGAIVARQVLLSGSANSSASANVANTRSQLDNAKRIEQQKKDAIDAAQKKLDEDKAKLAADQAVNPATDTTSKEINELNSSQIPSDTKALSTSQDEYKRAQDASQAIEENFNAALTAAASSASGSGNFGDTIGGQKNIDKDTADKIAVAVTNIVSTVVGKGHLTDGCIAFLSSTAPDKPSGTKTLELCKKIIDADLAQKPQGQNYFDAL